MHSFAPQRVYVSASVVKAMLLVAYLRGIGNRAPDAGERASLGPMITVSSNDAADTVYHRVGDAALYGVARLAGMRSFSVAGYWGNAQFSAQDQARFFNRIDRLVPTGVARLRPRPPVLDRELSALGLLALLAGRRASRPSSRAAGAGRAPGNSCMRPRCSSAGTLASRWRCSPTGIRRMTTGPRRCGGLRSGCSGTAGGPGRGRRRRRTTRRRRPGRAPRGELASWTCIASGRASA